MSDQLSMFGLMTCADTRSVISLLASADGASPCGSQDGPTADLSGLAPVHVSRFRSLDGGVAMPIDDTSGPLFTASSPSAGLQWCLESRLRARMGGSGSPLFALTWRQVDMPSGPPICALRALVRRTFGNACSSWVSPTAEDHRRGVKPPRPWDTGVPLSQQVALASWPTPCQQDGPKGGPSQGTDRLPAAAQLAQLQAWPTPVATDFKHGRTRERDGWGMRLNDTVTTRGAIATGFPAPTEKRGQLNPAFSRWLIGLPSEWDLAAPLKANRG